MIDLKNITITDEFEDKVSSKKKVIAARLGKPEKNEWFKIDLEILKEIFDDYSTD